MGLLALLLSVVISSVIISPAAGAAYQGPDFGSRTLRSGMTGGDVRDLQVFLNRAGYDVGFPDGVFGWQTDREVRNFQEESGLAVDGIVGLKTFAAIKAVNDGNPRIYTVKPGDTLYFIALRNGLTVDQLNQANGWKPELIYPGQTFYLIDPNRPAPPGLSGLPLAAILQEKGIAGLIPDLKILVDKSDHYLTLYSGSSVLKSYAVAVGDGGLGDKQRAGDHKTPEGTFYLPERLVLSPADKFLGSRWLRVSYPNLEDARRGLDEGIIDQAAYQEIGQANNNRVIPPQTTALGGGIGIHGGGQSGDNQGDYWTWGCIGLTDHDVDEIYDYIPAGAKLVIRF